MERNVLEYLEQAEKRFSNKIAVIDEHSQMTFSELLDASKRIGSALAEKIKIGNPVAVLAEKSISTLCAFFGIVEAGGFYVLLNPELPQYRLEQIQSVLQAEYIITDEEHKPLALSLASEEKILDISELIQTEANEQRLSLIRQSMIDTSPLYANFTSGSTGVPKGVLVSHRSVLDFISVFTDEFGIDETDIIGNQAPFDFDVSVKDIYSAMRTGATLVIIPKPLFSSPAKLVDYICDHNVTTMIWAVSAVCLISAFHGLDYRVPSSVKRILFSGEEMPLKHLENWMAHLPSAEFVNLYGPTEITCNCTFHRVSRDNDYSCGIPIGNAFQNERVFLLDEENKLVTKCDTVGEICVSGTALALGYYNNPEQTSKAFCQNPLNSCYPERIYRTGDLAKYTENGELIFCGRKDFQIKHMGHRIELEEIERAISEVDGVERLCAVYDSGCSKLYGFYVGEINKKDLRTRLRQYLPVYMIPNSFHQIEAFPITKNGKVDRKKLIDMR